MRTQTFLRRALRGNALFSALSGAALVVAPGFMVSLTGLGTPLLVRTVGLALVLFAADLWLNARRPAVHAGRAAAAVAMDLLWVVASAVLLAVGVEGLTRAGWWTVAIVAEVVLLWAVLQAYGLRKARYSG